MYDMHCMYLTCMAIDLIIHSLQRIEFIFETIIMQDHIRSTCHIWILINILFVLSNCEQIQLLLHHNLTFWRGIAQSAKALSSVFCPDAP